MRWKDYYLLKRGDVWLTDPYDIVVPTPAVGVWDRTVRHHVHRAIAEVIVRAGGEYPRRLIVLWRGKISDQLIVPFAKVVGKGKRIVEWVTHDMYVPSFDGPSWCGSWYVNGEVAHFAAIPLTATARQLREFVGFGYEAYVDWYPIGVT